MSDAKIIPPISTLVVVVPIAHLVVAATWVWGWTTGFGSGVYMLADAKDVFSLSVGDLVAVYLGAAVAPALMWVISPAKRESTASVPPIEPGDLDAELDALRKKLRDLIRTSQLSGAALLICAGICTLIVIDAYARGVAIGAVAIGLMIWPLGIVLLKVQSLPRSNSPYWIPTVLAVALCLSAAINGVIIGQSDRH